MAVERVVLVDPDPDCRVCDGTGKDFFIGPHTGHVYICECECSIEYHPWSYDESR